MSRGWLTGTQDPVFSCMRVPDFVTVKADRCDGVAPPPVEQRSCNSQPCPPRWRHILTWLYFQYRIIFIKLTLWSVDVDNFVIAPAFLLATTTAVGLSSTFVCVSFPSVYPHDISEIAAARITKLDTEMFHQESWKSIYFGVKRSKIKVNEVQKQCRCGYLHSCECWIL